ncbi:glycolate oxidase subunit GlcE [Pigmentiphaga soli]|uniref:Glycolate oxidase subunit GlcE n=1 Tax=Pigmentiphaga soli TaxID=1007095 RepID=A0ABP8GBV8_9BURK
MSDLRARVILAQAARRPLFIRGGGSKAFYGLPVDGAATLDMSPYQGLIDYQPSELVLTARAGTRLAEIESVLAAQGQMLAFEPPHFAPGATLGGAVATALSGPRRASAGGVRDFVLGTRLLDAQGRVLRFGGEVMKNVAGYDVSRLLAGSLGTLGVILDVSVKVLPLPACERSLCFEADEAGALDRLNRWAGRPLPISASSWLDGPEGGRLTVRVSGSEPAVAAACRTLGGERLDDAAAADWWRGLRDQTHPFLTARPLWRLSVPPATPPLGRGATLIEWGGAQRWLCGEHDAGALRAAAAAAGGHATLFRPASQAQARELGVFQPLAPALATIHKRLKNEFDPSGVFNPGRMYPDL